MINFTRYSIILLCIIATGISCESEKRYPDGGYIPNTPEATEQLEAQYFWTPQNKISSPYWKDANYVKLSLSNISTKNLYSDGYLNMTGTYNGLSDFNKGNDPKATIKAGYDDTYLYILVEWKDTTADASYQTWLWQGPTDKRKSDTATGWTSQRNNDNITILFDTDNTSVKDAWKWSLAYTALFDIALNMSADANGLLNTPDKISYYRNASNSSSRIGPQYEWNGERQEIALPDGSIKILDPAYYLSDGNKITFNGDMKSGENVFNNTADCKFCHGINGNGIIDEGSEGGPLNKVFTNKYSREGLLDFISSSSHEGGGNQYWGKIKNDTVAQQNLIAFIRGIAGVPGQVVKYSDDLSDIQALSNIVVGGIETKNTQYQVLFKKKLIPEEADDVNFDPASTYQFSVRFSDNDEINYIGSSKIELVFKSNTL
jgi:hypothetical protein